MELVQWSSIFFYVVGSRETNVKNLYFYFGSFSATTALFSTISDIITPPLLWSIFYCPPPSQPHSIKYVAGSYLLLGLLTLLKFWSSYAHYHWICGVIYCGFGWRGKFIFQVFTTKTVGSKHLVKFSKNYCILKSIFQALLSSELNKLGGWFLV